LIGRKIGETEYVLSAIPLGGYVKPLGEEIGEELKEEEKHRAFNYQPVWKRAAIIIAGPVFNFVLAYLIFAAFLALNHPVEIPNLDVMTARQIDNISKDSPAEKAGLKVGDIIASIDGKKVSTLIEVDGIVIKNPGRELALKVKRDDKIIETKITPKPKKIKDVEGNEIEIGVIGVSRISSIIGDVLEGQPADLAGLKRNDSIVAIDGKLVNNWQEMAGILSGNPGKELTLTIKRNNKAIEIKVTPRPEIIKDAEGNESTVGRIGISGRTPFYLIESRNIFDIPLKALQAVYQWSVLIIEVITELLTGGNDQISVKDVGGPILIVNAAKKAAEIGAYTYFNFIAFISINLAIMNLLPVPVLDGGHLMFLTYEKLRGKPLSDRIMMAANKFGLALILLLIVLVFYNDTMKIVVPWVQKTLISN
jgi:regulator of sigma E protease